MLCCSIFLFFFFNDTATTEIYTLSLHDALPICWAARSSSRATFCACTTRCTGTGQRVRSEEHTSELQSQFHLVCRLLLEKKKKRDAPVGGRDPTLDVVSRKVGLDEATYDRIVDE